MIDMRREFNELLNGGDKMGRWILLRRFSKEYSEYWDPATHEAVGGPAYKYTDELIRAFTTYIVSRSIMQSQGMMVAGPINFDETYIKICVKHDVVVEENDEFFELKYEGFEKPKVVYTIAEENIAQRKVAVKERYKVKKMDPVYEENGKVAYKIVYAYRYYKS